MLNSANALKTKSLTSLFHFCERCNRVKDFFVSGLYQIVVGYKLKTNQGDVRADGGGMLLHQKRESVGQNEGQDGDPESKGKPAR